MRQNDFAAILKPLLAFFVSAFRRLELNAWLPFRCAANSFSARVESSPNNACKSVSSNLLGHSQRSLSLYASMYHRIENAAQSTSMWMKKFTNKATYYCKSKRREYNHTPNNINKGWIGSQPVIESGPLSILPIITSTTKRKTIRLTKTSFFPRFVRWISIIFFIYL